jgi:hypothetical protein
MGLSDEGLETFQLLSDINEGVVGLGDIGGATLGCTDLSRSPRRRAPGSESLEMCHILARERDGELGGEADGDFEARRYAPPSPRFVPPWLKAWGPPALSASSASLPSAASFLSPAPPSSPSSVPGDLSMSPGPFSPLA